MLGWFRTDLPGDNSTVAAQRAKKLPSLTKSHSIVRSWGRCSSHHPTSPRTRCEMAAVPGWHSPCRASSLTNLFQYTTRASALVTTARVRLGALRSCRFVVAAWLLCLFVARGVFCLLLSFYLYRSHLMEPFANATHSLRSPHSAALDLLNAHGPEPRRPARARHRAPLQDRPRAVRGDREGVDAQVRYVVACAP